LPLQVDSRRMVRAVNLRVAGHARPIECEGRIWAAGHRLMPTLYVTLLAEHRRPRNKQRCVIRPVRLMAVRATFAYRRVLEQERPALLGVALIAGFVDAGCPHHLLADRAMWLVTRRAVDLLLTVLIAEQMCRALELSFTNIGMALETSISLR